jgi:hypothetical protein
LAVFVKIEMLYFLKGWQKMPSCIFSIDDDTKSLEHIIIDYNKKEDRKCILVKEDTQTGWNHYKINRTFVPDWYNACKEKDKHKFWKTHISHNQSSYFMYIKEISINQYICVLFGNIEFPHTRDYIKKETDLQIDIAKNYVIIENLLNDLLNNIYILTISNLFKKSDDITNIVINRISPYLNEHINTYSECLEEYNTLYTNKKINQLPQFDKNIDIRNDNPHESEYNKRVASEKGLKLLDGDTQTTNGFEICDLYNPIENIYHCVKRLSKDLRVLVVQVLNGAIYLEDNISTEIVKKYQLNKSNMIFSFDIILDKKKGSELSYIYRIPIGQISLILKSRNIKTQINFIDVIEKKDTTNTVVNNPNTHPTQT